MRKSRAPKSGSACNDAVKYALGGLLLDRQSDARLLRMKKALTVETGLTIIENCEGESRVHHLE